MDLLNLKNEALYQIVFRDRNREYGSYLLWKKYPRTLLWSVVFGLIVFLLAVFIPFTVYFLQGPELVSDDFIYEVEYMPINPPESNDLNELARALAKPPEDNQQVPVIKDTIAPENVVKPQEPLKEEYPETDSVGEAGGVKDGTGTGDASGLATVIDVFPRFPGGDESRLAFLKRNVRYPAMALKGGIQGVVVVVFIIETDGSLSGIKIERGVGAGCDEESVRVVKMMPKWEPGKRQGKAVRVMVRMPIVFRIPGKPA
jgi:protein TonB